MHYSKLLTCLLAGAMCGWPAAANSEEPAKTVVAIVELQVQPAELVLKGASDSRRLLVTGKTADGRYLDLTADAQLTLAGPAATLDDDRFVTPHAVGDTVLTVAYGGKSVAVPVKVSNVARTPISFVRDVLPVMTKTGCNQGACHGGQQGKAGFKLSLRGYDPQYDYAALTDDLAGRRFNRAQPEQSLMLLKPTQGVPHEGGFLFDEESRYYQLIKTWIAEGCQYDNLDRVQSLEVLPKSILLDAVGQKQSQIVIVVSSA